MSHCSLDFNDSTDNVLKQQELSDFLQRPISTYLRHRYDSIDTAVSIQDSIDFAFTLSEDFNMNDFLDTPYTTNNIETSALLVEIKS